MSETVFNRYDIRGEWPEEIDEDFSYRLGKACGTYAQRKSRGTVVIGYDSRNHSKTAADAFADGVIATGASLINVGMGTTDYVAMAANHYGGIGVMVTASHHAWSRTGFKLLYEQGHGFSNDDLDDVKTLFRTQDFEKGEGYVLNEAAEFTEEYMERIKKYMETFEIPHETTVLIDCCSGGASQLAPELFEDIGFNVISVQDTTDNHTSDPEPKEATRQNIVDRLEQTDADLAIGFDPDADRVYTVHPERGWIDGNELFYILGRIIQPDRIAASIDTSRLIEELDAEVEYSQVGDVFVSALGVDIDAALLGEPNGHYAVTDVCWYNSGILSGLLIAAHSDEIDSMLKEAPSYHTERRVFHTSARTKDDVMQQAIKYAAKQYDVLSTIDGIKFTDGDITALVRPSGTSSKIRLIVDGQDEKHVIEQANTLYTNLFDKEE